MSQGVLCCAMIGVLCGAMCGVMCGAWCDVWLQQGRQRGAGLGYALLGARLFFRRGPISRDVARARDPDDCMNNILIQGSA